MKTKPKPIAHQWEALPVHAGPDEWRCDLCGVETTFQASAPRPPEFCGPRAAAVTAHAMPVASAHSLALNHDSIKPTLSDV